MMHRKGFTIIELGIVILLIAGVAFSLTPFVKVIQKKSRYIKCMNNLRKISLAVRIYALEHDGSLPGDLQELFLAGYIADEEVFDCPFSQTIGAAGEPEYIYIGAKKFTDEGNTPLVYDKEMNHPDGGMYVLFLNGEIEETARWPSS